MKKIQILIFSFILSSNAFSEWNFHSSSLQGDTFHLHLDTIIEDGDYVYFWNMKSYLMPNKFGDYSSKVFVQGDCINFRLKYLTYVWYKEPMGEGLGERSDTESGWENPAPESVGKDLLRDVCKMFIRSYSIQ